MLSSLLNLAIEEEANPSAEKSVGHCEEKQPVWTLERWMIMASSCRRFSCLPEPELNRKYIHLHIPKVSVAQTDRPWRSGGEVVHGKNHA